MTLIIAVLIILAAVAFGARAVLAGLAVAAGLGAMAFLGLVAYSEIKREELAADRAEQAKQLEADSVAMPTVPDWGSLEYDRYGTMPAFASGLGGASRKQAAYFLGARAEALRVCNYYGGRADDVVEAYAPLLLSAAERSYGEAIAEHRAKLIGYSAFCKEVSELETKLESNRDAAIHAAAYR